MFPPFLLSIFLVIISIMVNCRLSNSQLQSIKRLKGYLSLSTYSNLFGGSISALIDNMVVKRLFGDNPVSSNIIDIGEIQKTYSTAEKSLRNSVTSIQKDMNEFKDNIEGIAKNAANSATNNIMDQLKKIPIRPANKIDYLSKRKDFIKSLMSSIQDCKDQAKQSLSTLSTELTGKDYLNTFGETIRDFSSEGQKGAIQAAKEVGIKNVEVSYKLVTFLLDQGTTTITDL